MTIALVWLALCIQDVGALEEEIRALQSRDLHDAAVRAVCGDHLGQKPLSTMLAIRRCGKLTRADISSPRQVAIERARGKIPSVEVASGGSFAVTARRR